MNVGESVKCNLFEKNGVIIATYDLSSSKGLNNESVDVIKLVWEDGQEEVINVSEYPQRLKRLSDTETEKAQPDAFGAGLVDIDTH